MERLHIDATSRRWIKILSLCDNHLWKPFLTEPFRRDLCHVGVGLDILMHNNTFQYSRSDGAVARILRNPVWRRNSSAPPQATSRQHHASFIRPTVIDTPHPFIQNHMLVVAQIITSFSHPHTASPKHENKLNALSEISRLGRTLFPFGHPEW
jgi:hypothetical protein